MKIIHDSQTQKMGNPLCEETITRSATNSAISPIVLSSHVAQSTLSVVWGLSSCEQAYSSEYNTLLCCKNPMRQEPDGVIRVKSRFTRKRLAEGLL